MSYLNLEDSFFRQAQSTYLTFNRGGSILTTSTQLGNSSLSLLQRRIKNIIFF